MTPTEDVRGAAQGAVNAAGFPAGARADRRTSGVTGKTIGLTAKGVPWTKSAGQATPQA